MADRILYTYTSGAVGTWSADLMRLDGFTDEANALDWWTLNPEGAGDPSTKAGWFKQLPQGPTRVSFKITIGTARAFLMFTNSLSDVIWMIRDPANSPLPDGFAGKTYDWSADNEVVEGGYRYALVSIVNEGGVTTALLSVESLAEAPRPPSTWKLAPVGYYAPNHGG